MNQVIDLSNTIAMKAWVYSDDINLEYDAYDFGHQQQDKVYLSSSHSGLANLTHKQRLNQIEAWQTKCRAIDKSAVNLNFVPKTTNQVVIENVYWRVEVAVTPFNNYESLIVPKQSCTSLSSLSVAQKTALSAIIGRLATRYDNLFMASLDCEISWYKSDDSEINMFARYSPANIHTAGPHQSMLDAQKDITQHKLARQLQSLSDIHFQDVFTF